MPFRTAVVGLLLFVSLNSVASAELTSEIKISGQTLKLNGAGKRSKTFVQIYESGLYLAKPSRDAKAIVESDQLMAIRVRITSGFVSRDSLVTSLRDSLKTSTGGKLDSIARETAMFEKTLQEEVKKNDVFDFIQVPQKGLYVLKNGQVKGTIPGINFKRALYGIWLSDKPVDKGLRQAMLQGGTNR
ncbi:MAG: chalcone isomerase family protein [Pirellulaceae bacterium]